MHKAVIFTEETNVKFPEIIERKDKVGRGKNVREIEGFLEKLEEEGLPIPSDNIEKEEKYKKYLKEFVRPANKMFAGKFREVQIFREKLEEIIESEIFIISGRYGLIEENKKIIPYDYHIKNKSDIKKLDKGKGFSNDMVEKVQDANHAIFILPTMYIDYLLSKDFFESIPEGVYKIIIAGKSVQPRIKSISNTYFLKRKGVSRIPKKYRKEIVKFVRGGKNG